MSLKDSLRCLLSGLFIILLMKKYEGQLGIPSSTFVAYKQAHVLLYDAVGDSVKANKESIQFNKDLSLQKDMISFFHPDTILEDQFTSVSQNTYDTHKQWAAVNSFISDQQKSNSRVIYNQFLFNPYAINQEYFAHQKYPSIYEKYYRLPLYPDLDLKSKMTLGQNDLYQRLKNRNASEACLREATFLKKTISLSQKDQCLQAMDILNTKRYMQNKLPLKYLVKTDLHRQQGVQFLDETKVIDILKKYDNGTKCGQLQDDWTFQEFIFNPIFYQDRAFTFRIYILFASTKPWITYIYTRSMLQVCMRPWSQDDLYLSRHLCNALEARAYWGCLWNTPEQNCQNHTDSAHYEEMIPAPWFTNMTDYLIDQNYVKDKSWTEAYFYPTIAQKLGYLFNEATTMPEDSRLCALYGLDFEIDQDLDIWLLDFNVFPSLAATIDDRQNMLTQFYDDTAAVIMIHLRQKYLRIKDLIQNILIPHVQKKLELSQKQIEEAIDLAMTDVDLSEGKYLHNYYKVNLKDYKKEC